MLEAALVAHGKIATMFPNNLTRIETRHRAAVLTVQRYQIEIDLSGRGLAEPEQTFHSDTTITFTARPDAGQSTASLNLDLIADRVVSAELDGVPLDPATFSGSQLPLQLNAGNHTVRVAAICRFSRTGEGLHRFVDPADDRIYLYTQFEPANARRMFACFEQPDLKATFAISAIAPADWTVVSCGELRSRSAVPAYAAADNPSGPSAEDFVRFVFADTKPVSTYLTALVAGPYHHVKGTISAPSGQLPAALYCRRSLAEHLDPERIFDVTERGFAVFEECFGVPYQFGKYDQVFVPEYNGGAMENIGCVTFRDEYVFRSRATPAMYQVRDDTILHELSHMWFGDLVTMRWWDDLWLKESFATWASNFGLSQITDTADAAWAAFTNGFKSWAYRQDQLPSTHPIAADIIDLEAVEQNFDGITYAKGAAVLIQLVSYVGQDAFLAGCREYFRQQAYQNTTLSDFLSPLSAASGRDLTSWSKQWLETAGVNTLAPELTVDADNIITGAVVLQTAPAEHPTLRRHRVAIGRYAEQAGRLQRIGRFETDITGARTELPQLIGLPRPELLLVNDDDLTYAKLRLDPHSLATIRHRLADIDNVLARAVCWAAAWDLCRDGLLTASAYVDLVLAAVSQESDQVAVRSVLGQATTAAWRYAPPTDQTAVQQRWQDGVWQLLTAAAPGSDLQLALAKAYPNAATDSAAADRLSGWLTGAGVPDGLTIDPELRWSVVMNLSRLGRLDGAAIDAEAARDRTVTGVEQAAAAKAAQPTAAAKSAAWQLATAASSVPNGVQRAITLAFWQRGQATVLEPYEGEFLRVAEQISSGAGGWAGKGYALRENVLRNLFPLSADLPSFLARLDAWLAKAELADSVRRSIVEGRANTIRALNCQRLSADS